MPIYDKSSLFIPLLIVIKVLRDYFIMNVLHANSLVIRNPYVDLDLKFSTKKKKKPFNGFYFITRDHNIWNNSIEVLASDSGFGLNRYLLDT